MVRRGVFGLLLLCVPQIVGGGDAKDGVPRRGESVRDSAVKPVDEHPSRPIRTASASDRPIRAATVRERAARTASREGDRPGKAEELTRFRIVTSDGVLVIYDAAIPPGTNQSRDREGADRQNREREQPANSVNPGFVGYWNDFDTEQLYVFDRLLFTPDDAAVAIGCLERDFVLEPGLFASDDLGVSRISSIPPATILVLERSEGDDGTWQPASRELVLAVMGFAADEEGVGGVAGTIWDCWPVMLARADEPLPRPPPGASPDEVLQLAVASAGCPPGGCGCCGDPCCLDPCACAITPGECCDPHCSNCDPNDCDSDGIPNGQDSDIDGDGISNSLDPDMDGDGIPNTSDCDIDGDGLFDWEDPDRDGDGIANEEDTDSDGDGIVRWEDPKPNGCEGPCDSSSDPCCGVTDPCDPACGHACSPECGVCDDGNGCTDDYCYNGDCISSCPWGLAEGEGSAAVVEECSGLAFDVEITEITFTKYNSNNMHPLYENGTFGEWETGPLYGTLNWRSVNNPNRPTCYTKNTRMRLRVKFKVTAESTEPYTRPLTVTGPDGIVGHAGIALVCGTHFTEQYIVMDTNLPDEVRAYEPMELTWKVQRPNSDEYLTIATTQHNIYVVNAVPLTYNTSNLPTLKRVSSVCKWASGASTPDGIAMKIYTYLSDHNPPGPISLIAEPLNYWGLMVPGTPTECSGLANLMRLACGVVGVPASIGYIYATTDCNCFSTSLAAWDTRPMNGRTEQLWYQAGGLNKWEAVCVVNNHYYGPKVGHNQKPLDLLRAIIGSNELTGKYQRWTYTNPNTGEQFPSTAPPIPVPLPTLISCP